MPDELSTYERLEQIKARLAAITQGEWQLTTYYLGLLDVCCGTNEMGAPRTIPDSDADTQFIAAAPGDVQFLLDRLAEWQSIAHQALGALAQANEGLQSLKAEIHEIYKLVKREDT